jgi:hypothetical protein
MRRVTMQLTLVFFELPEPAQKPQPPELRDAATRAEALNILARIIAQSFEVTSQAEATDE